MERVAFGPFSYDRQQRLLYRDAEPLALGSRGVALLHLLLSRRGQVVSKGELMDAAWPGLAVEESNLPVQIALLRRLLGAAAHGGQWIVTVARTGYRFIPESDVAPPADLTRFEHPRVAVLPFVDFSGRPDTPLAQYLLQDVVTALTRFRGLSVVPVSSSARVSAPMRDARTVARQLDVHYVVEGSFRRRGEQLRLSLQLVDGSSGATVWAGDLHMPLVDGVGDTDELAGRAAAALDSQVHLAEMGRVHRRHPASVEAHDYYLRGRCKILTSTEADNAVALDLFMRALALEPDNIEYLAGAAEAIHHRTSVGWRPIPGASRTIALELSRRGLDRAGGDAASLGLFGSALMTAHEEDAGSILTARAAAMNPYSALALVCDGLARTWDGDIDAAEHAFSRAADLASGDPTQRFAYQGLGRVAALRGDWASALHWGQVTNAISPGLSGGNTLRIAASTMLGRMEDARRYLQHYMLIAPGVSIRSLNEGQPFRDRTQIAPLFGALKRAGLPER